LADNLATGNIFGPSGMGGAILARSHAGIGGGRNGSAVVAASPHLPTPIQMLRDRAYLFFKERMTAFFDGVDQSLQDFADQATDRHLHALFMDAGQKIRLEKQALQAGFIESMVEAFNRLMPDSFDWRGVSAASPGIEIRENIGLEELKAVDTMISRANTRARRELKALNARIARVAGIRKLATSPVAPEFVCETFVSQIRPLGIGLKPTLVMLRYFELYLLNDWQDYIRSSNQLLKNLQILPALEGKTKLRAVEAATGQPARSKKPAPEANLPQVSPSLDFPARPARVVERADLLNRRRIGESPESRRGPVGGDSDSNLDELIRSARPDTGRRRPRPGAERHFGTMITELNEALARWPESSTPALDAANTRGSLPDTRNSSQGYGNPVSLEDLLRTISRLNSGTDRKKTEAALAAIGLEQLIKKKMQAGRQSYRALPQMERSIIHLIDLLFANLRQRTVASEYLDAVLLRLMLPVASLVLQAPDFFETPKHPVRRLIKEILKATNGLPGHPGPAADPLKCKIEAVLDAMAQTKGEMRPVTGILVDFIDFIDKEKRCRSIDKKRLLPDLAMPEMAVIEELRFDLQGAPQSSTAAREQVNPEMLDRVDSLRQGTWVDFGGSSDTPRRCMLWAVEQPMSRYVFADRKGNKVAEACRSQLALAMQRGNLRVVDNSRLFDEAFAAVVSGVQGRNHLA